MSRNDLLRSFVLLLMATLGHCARVEHNFTLSEFLSRPFGSGSVALVVAGINEDIVPPTLTVHTGDVLVIRVENKLPIPITFHCHGLEYRHQPHMDGPEFVTQYPISPFNGTFTYEFDVMDVPGTYWYHPHTSLHGITNQDHLRGPLIVLPSAPATQDPYASNVSTDATLFITDWWSASTQASQYDLAVGGALIPNYVDEDGTRVASSPFESMLCNGRGGSAVLPVKHNLTTTSTIPAAAGTRGLRLRVINGGYHHSFEFSVDAHILVVIATDGSDTEPFECDSIQIAPGERFDVLLKLADSTAVQTSPFSSVFARAAVIVGRAEEVDAVKVPIHFTTQAGPHPLPPSTPHLPRGEMRVLNCVWRRGRAPSKCLSVTDLKEPRPLGRPPSGTLWKLNHILKFLKHLDRTRRAYALKNTLLTPKRRMQFSKLWVQEGAFDPL